MGRTNKTLQLVVANNTLSTLRAVHRPCLVWGQHDDVNVLFFFFFALYNVFCFVFFPCLVGFFGVGLYFPFFFFNVFFCVSKRVCALLFSDSFGQQQGRRQ